MDLAEIAPGVLLATGRAYASNATLFLDGGDALLVDGLGSMPDAVDLRDELGRRGIGVSLVIATHYFSDHMAALRLFPEARVIAHRLHRATFDSEDFRSDEEATFWRPADIALDGGCELRFGPHTLDVLHVPGHTPSSLAVDVAAADLLLASDTAVGRIAYLRYGAAGDIRRSLERLVGLARGRVVLGHSGVSAPGCLAAAVRYLERLEQAVRATRRSGGAITTIGLAGCLDAGERPTDWEARYHARNLDIVEGRSLFD